MKDAYWKTICGDCSPFSSEKPQAQTSRARLKQPQRTQYRAVDEEDCNTFAEWKEKAGGHDRLRISAQRYRGFLAMENAVRSHTMSRGFFVTKQGYIGIRPPTMNEGDYVCVLIGGSVPFILRPETAKESA